MSSLEIILPEPHSDKQSIIMNCARIPGLQELWVSCGTKFGKTLSGTGAYSMAFPLMNHGIIRHIAPIYSQAMIGMRYAQKLLPGAPYIESRKSGTPSISWTDKNKTSVIEYWHGQNPESLEGEGTAINLLDEASKMKHQVYLSVRTTVTQTRGLVIPMSTPRGKNWFYIGCMQAREEMEWCLKKGIQPTKIFITAPTIDNKYIDPQAVLDARKNLPDRLFRQYYLAEFCDDGEVFPYFRQAVYGEPLLFQTDNQIWFHEDIDDYEDIVIGADWGKQNDFTVLTAWTVKSRMLVGFMRFRGIDYVEAIRNLVWFSGKYKHMLMIYHDQTGLGNVIDDLLGHTELPYEGVTFTNRSKSLMINSMMMAFQRRDIHIPNWKAMTDELDSFEVKVNEIGTMKYSAPTGKHDDIVCSMFLGWSALEEFSPTRLEVVSLDDLESLDIQKHDFGPNQDYNQWMPIT